MKRDDHPSLHLHCILHCLNITLLYYSQGLIQGTLHVTGTLLLSRDKNFPLSLLALLSMTSYSFSLKFLWSPVVDAMFFSTSTPRRNNNNYSIFLRKFLHRRLQWVLATFLVIIYSLQWIGEEFGNLLHDMGDTTTTTQEGGRYMERYSHFHKLLYGLFLASFASATQDVAVDAWAVEALPDAQQHFGGVLQLFGLACGLLSTSLYQGAFLSTSPSTPTDARWFFGKFCSQICLLSAALSLVTSVVNRDYPRRMDTLCVIGLPNAQVPTSERNSAPKSSLLQSYRDTVSAIVSKEYRQIFLCLSCSGFTMASYSAMAVEMQRRSWLSSADISSLSVFSTSLQVLAVTSGIVTSIVSRYEVDRILVWTSWMEFPLMVWCAAVLQWMPQGVVDAYPRVVYWTYALVAVFFLTLRSVFTFSAWQRCYSRAALRTPHIVGSALTVLNSAGNFGYAAPASGCLFVISLLTGDDSDEEDHRRAAWRSQATLLVALGTMAVSLILRYVYFLPGLKVVAAQGKKNMDM